MASRVGKEPIECPAGVVVSIQDKLISVKGGKGQLEHQVHSLVNVLQQENVLTFTAANDSLEANALLGTTRALVNNMVVGVSTGFERHLELVGVGYRAQAKGNVLNLSLGFSHPVDMEVPKGITVETPSQNKIVVKGTDKQKVGQFCAEIRALRPPEPYKGKGVRYSDEVVIRKDAKKK